jgi:hypothetical protein
MDRSLKERLRKLGKAEVARRSAEHNAALKAANPVSPGDKGWAGNYKRGTLREKWLREKLPVLRQREVTEWFVVLPNGGAGWRPYLGGYVQCQRCGSVAPTVIPKRLFYCASCECGNIKWRRVGPWRRATVLYPEQTVPVKLIGKG